jgi:hypothetical protein
MRQVAVRVRAGGDVGAEADVDVNQVPDGARSLELERPQGGAHEAVVVVLDQQQPPLARRVPHAFVLGEARSDRLLHEDVCARLERAQDERLVRLGRGQHVHRIRLGLAEHSPIVREARPDPEALGDRLDQRFR